MIDEQRFRVYERIARRIAWERRAYVGLWALAGFFLVYWDIMQLVGEIAHEAALIGVVVDPGAEGGRRFVEVHAILEQIGLATLEGVGQLIELATQRGRAARPGIKLGICGEHGGDPSSIYFCEKVGLDYVSCSPYRVPIARLAAAQAAIGGKAQGQA